MSREFLKKVINGGDAKVSKERIFIVCEGKRWLHSEQEIDGDISIDLEVHCNDVSQLDMQPQRKKKEAVFAPIPNPALGSTFPLSILEM